MDGFKNSTKTHYSCGGRAYAKGGSAKGAAKVAKVMGEFKRGELHSGTKKGPEVTSRKQAMAIALSEADRAKPIKRAGGGRATMADLNRANRDTGGMNAAQEAAAGRAVARGNRMQGLEAREEQKLMREARDTRKVSPRTREVTTERRATMQRDIREPLIRNPLMDTLSTLPSQRGEMPIRRKSGGLAVMPHGKKC